MKDPTSWALTKPLPVFKGLALISFDLVSNLPLEELLKTTQYGTIYQYDTNYCTEVENCWGHESPPLVHTDKR